MAGRSYKTEAVVLRSIRFGEADRVLHLYTAERGRIGAVAKGVRKTKSRFGGRLEPLSHVELMLHQGGGELQTITGVQLVRAHRCGPRRLLPAERRADRSGGDAAALHRAGAERPRVHRAHALPRPARRDAACSGSTLARPARARVPAEAALALRLPAASDELCRVRRGRRDARRLLAARGRRRLPRVRERGGGARAERRGDRRHRGAPRAPARRRGRARRSANARGRDALRVVTASYEYHGGFRLRHARRA